MRSINEDFPSAVLFPIAAPCTKPQPIALIIHLKRVSQDGINVCEEENSFRVQMAINFKPPLVDWFFATKIVTKFTGEFRLQLHVVI